MNKILCPVKVSPTPPNVVGLGPRSQLILERGRNDPSLLVVRHEKNGVLGYLPEHMSDFILSHRNIDLSEIDVRIESLDIRHRGLFNLQISLLLPPGA